MNNLELVGYLNTVTGHLWTPEEQPDAAEQSGLYEPLVKLSDVQSLMAERDALAAENAQMQVIINAVTDLDNEPQYHDEGMGCGLEERGITDRYEAMRHGWDAAMERVYGEVIPCAEEIEFTATEAAIAEIRAQGLDHLARICKSLGDDERNACTDYVGRQCEISAETLRAGRKG